MFGKKNTPRTMVELQDSFVEEAQVISENQQDVIETKTAAIKILEQEKEAAELEKSMADNFLTNVRKLFEPSN